MASADHKPRILLVDDDEALARAVSRGLERAGFVLTVVRSGPAALEALARDAVAVVVTDQQMPEMTGSELISKMLALDPALAPRIILTSGDLSRPETTATIERTGCRSIAKPYTSAELALLVRAILARTEAANMDLQR